MAFSSDHAVITMGDHSYHVSWTVYMINNTHLKKMHLTNISYERIDSKYQNSAILRENNSYISLAEIFSFGTAMDASIAVKNLMKVNETYEIMFHLKSGNHHSTFSMNGNDPQTGSITSGSALPGTGYAMIPSGDWSINMGHVNVNWQNEMSIFHVGSVATDTVSSSVNLPFGPVTLMGNETYSIDPVIKPEIIVHCACSGGGGGGGSGGGGNPPGLSTIDGLSTNMVLPGKSITVSANVNNVGSGGVVLYLQAYNESSSTWHIITSVYVGSSTSPANLIWIDNGVGGSKYDWSQVRVYASNNYGSGSVSSTKTIYSYYNSPLSSIKVYSSNGSSVGTIVNSVYMHARGVAYGNDMDTGLATVFVPSNSEYTVHSVNQSVVLVGGGGSLTSSPNFQKDPNIPIGSYFQNYTNNKPASPSTMLDVLSLALGVAAALPGLDGLAALSVIIGTLGLIPGTGNSITRTQTKDGVTGSFFYDTSASVTPPNPPLCGRIGAPYCSNQYATLGVYYGGFFGIDQSFKASYIFVVHVPFEYNTNQVTPGGSYSSPGYIGILKYTSAVDISRGPYHNYLYGGSDSLFYTMGYYN
ncbi:MAG: hypothetical protein ACYDCP_04330 [Thermoplasmataceae archaeon]